MLCAFGYLAILVVEGWEEFGLLPNSNQETKKLWPRLLARVYSLIGAKSNYIREEYWFNLSWAWAPGYLLKNSVAY